MPDAELKLARDINRIQQISIIPTLLDVICRSTGMGFAAVARVTQNRWIACNVRDEINFGLLPGGELRIETTICNEIRDHHLPVIIDQVDKNKDYCNHPTPKMYGFQSYISVPITRKNGEFFGTLCAIDPKPALISKPEIIGMFNLFAELISFHLSSLELVEQTNSAMEEVNKQLIESADENRQYKFISNHNLQEPLRKLRLFSDVLVNALDNQQIDKAKVAAFKINSNAQRFSMMIQDLTELKQINADDSAFELVDLNKIVAEVCAQLNLELESKNAVINIGILPAVNAITAQMEQLFYHLVYNAIKFSKKDSPLSLDIYMAPPEPDHIIFPPHEGTSGNYVEIRIKDNGIGMEKLYLERIFDIFSKLDYDQPTKGEGIGLAYCRKIVRNHRGMITAESELGKGTTFSIMFPTGSNSAT